MKKTGLVTLMALGVFGAPFQHRLSKLRSSQGQNGVEIAGTSLGDVTTDSNQELADDYEDYITDNDDAPLGAKCRESDECSTEYDLKCQNAFCVPGDGVGDSIDGVFDDCGLSDSQEFNSALNSLL